MTPTHLRRVFAGALLITLISGCGAFDVNDPTAIEDSDVANAIGADLLRRDALGRLYLAVSEGGFRSGLLTDEYMWRSTGGPTMELDRRDPPEELELAHYRLWQEARRAATLAVPALRTNGAVASARAHMGEMFAVRGFATLSLAELFCPGFPLHDVVDFKPVYGAPLSTDQAFERALVDFDSAVVFGADSARIHSLAQVGRARTLLGLGRFDEAAASAGTVPTVYMWRAEYDPSQQNRVGFLSEPIFAAPSLTVADSEGGNGLDFVTADDPRVETFQKRTSRGALSNTYGVTKYPNRSAPIVVASGIEARLIEAEAALRGGGDWLGMLNALRTDGTQSNGVWNPGIGGIAGLPPLDDPGNEEARVDLLFRERAFWLFGTGHRLGDVRRLMSRYGRHTESVFPTGLYAGGAGGVYGTATSFPFPAATETPFNPAVTGCTSR